MKCFEKLMRSRIIACLPVDLDPFQFAYKAKRPTEDAVAMALHAALTHLEHQFGIQYHPPTMTGVQIGSLGTSIIHLQLDIGLLSGRSQRPLSDAPHTLPFQAHKVSFPLVPVGATLQLAAPPSRQVLVGSRAILPCMISVGNASLDLNYLAVIWFFQNKEILRFDNKGFVSTSRRSFNQQEVDNGNFSLALSNVRISDEGVYTCVVVYSPEREDREIRLNVLDPPAITITQKQRNALSCSATGFYPKEINITWISETNPAVIVVSVIVSLLGIAAVIFIIWKHKRKSTFSLKPIVGPNTLTIGEETKLQCIGTNCPSDVQVTWSVRGGSDREIVLHQSGEDKATESLLSQYVVHSEKEGNNHITTLTFTLDKHMGATFGCKFVGGGKVKEKHFHTKTIQAKPKVPEPINIIFQGSHNLDLTLKLQRFYPKDIRIKWGCGEGPQQPGREEWRENSDLTWDLTSVYSVPRDLFKDPAFRVRVTWKHGSLGGPQSREVSVADFPWRPQVAMKIPTLREKVEATLSCRIFGYYPDDLTVQWFRLEKGGKKESPLDTETYRVSRTESQEQGDKTFACDTSVTFTPTVKSDDGAEFICRVGHPTQGVEKRSGQLHVYKSKGK
uniref:Ig-like domain-containing protein n=1 Tax=Xenopus tropicalis TaxID=8364 RepID=A0A1B8Y3Y0_XENTR